MFFFKQKTAYEMRISDWSSDVCSSDLLLPRIFTGQEWRVLDKGIRQRARALNAFLHDVYHRGEIVKAGIMPADIIYRNSAYLAEMADFTPPGKVYSHIVGIDKIGSAACRDRV